MRLPWRLLPTACLACACAAAGCTSGGEDPRPIVVATTTQAADLVRTVAGPRVHVHGVLAANSDPHDYEVRPRDVKALIGAVLVVRSGGDVDGWLDDAIDAAGSHAPVLDLLGRVRPEGADPHWWQDPRRAAVAVDAIGRALGDADPAGAPGYERRARAEARRLRALDAAVARCVRALPPAQRTLVTTHDALR